MKPLAIDLYCGLGGWAEGLLSEGWRVKGFDVEAHDYGTGGYPGELILRDVTTIHGSEFADAELIVGSPPCHEYSYMAMPWERAKQIIAALNPDGRYEKVAFPEGYTGSRTIQELNFLFDTCFRLQREASEAAGRYIPLIVENVRGAQRWVGRAKANFGSYYLWGEVGMVGKRVVAGVPRFGVSVQTASVEAQKSNPDGTNHGSGSWFKIADSKNRGANVTAAQRYRKEFQRVDDAGVKILAPGHYTKPGSGKDWFDGGAAKHGSKSNSRKAASARIAKIPFVLAQHIARVFKPGSHDGE